MKYCKKCRVGVTIEWDDKIWENINPYVINIWKRINREVEVPIRLSPLFSIIKERLL